jgi:hypothetical protein
MTIDHRDETAGREKSMADSWAGLVVFAGIMLVALGISQLMEGITALVHGEAYLVTADNMLLEPDPQTWGWTHLALGLISCAAGAGVLMGQWWARAIGVLFTAAGALLHFFFLATAPFWCTILICLEVLVIFALCAHGGDVRARHRARSTT